MTGNVLLDDILRLQEELEHRTEVENAAIELIIKGQYLDAIALLNTI